MNELFNYKEVRNKPSRNSFDLSHQHVFTAKLGQILPVTAKLMLPGDTAQLSVSHFTRTSPVETAANTRIKEYFDYFFVPLRLLWRNAPISLSMMTENSVYSQDEKKNSPVPLEHPRISTADLFATDGTRIAQKKPRSVLEHFICGDYTTNPTPANTERIINFLKLCQMLRLGVKQIPKNNDEMHQLYQGSFKVLKSSSYINLYKLLAYQKIYQDYFRNSQWESANPITYNVDYNLGRIYQIPDYKDNFWKNSTPFDLQYRNYEKDMFFGILPSAQFGEEAKAISEVRGILQGVTNGEPVVPSSTGGNDNKLSATVGILKYRQMQFLQKWKEIAISGSQDYKNQIYKHWGVSIPNELSFKCTHITGDSNFIDINEVINTALDADQKANIKGKGVGNSDGSQYETFTANDYGVLMCVYHTAPILQYATSGIDPESLKTNSADFPVPELDSIGLEPLHSIYLTQDIRATNTIGFTSRYIDFKTSVDIISGDFLQTMENWVSPIDDKFLDIKDYDSYNIDVNFFKVDPALLNRVFGVDVDPYQSTDQFKVNASLNMKFVRNLDFNGMPY